MNRPAAGVASIDEAKEFLARRPDIEAIDIVLTDCHGIGRGKSIRRHELVALYRSGRGMPASLFAQDVAGDDVEDALTLFDEGGGDERCWPIPGTLGALPATGRGVAWVSMYTPNGHPLEVEPRHALARQMSRAQATGYAPMGAMELEFYLVDRERDARGRAQPARYALTGRRSFNRNTMSVDELDEMAPFFDAVKRAEWRRLALEVTEAEWDLYGFTV